MVPDAQGITYINDLSPLDMEKVRKVARVELTITFDDHNLQLNQPRPRRAAKPRSIPGVYVCVWGVCVWGGVRVYVCVFVGVWVYKCVYSSYC